MIDKVRYSDDAPWPESADGDGPALVRVDPWAYGNDLANWQATAVGGTPGTPDGTDTTPPAVAGSEFRAGVLTVRFSEDVSTALDAGDLTVTRDATGQPVDLAAAVFSYDVYRALAAWDLSACGLVSGEAYTATLPAAGVSDPAGHPLDGDGNGTGGDDYTFGLSLIHI